MRVELLYTEGCPGAAALLARVRVLLDEADDGTPIQQRLIVSDQDARRERFLGSPTLRVDGRDVDPDAHARDDYAVACRLYPTADGRANIPPDAWVRAALSTAATRRR
jgi:hypothetical protein